MNIADAFLFQARHQPTAVAICAPGLHYNAVSYGRLSFFMANIASRAVAAGLRRGHVAAIVTDDPVFHLALVLALAQIGAVSLSTGKKLPGGFKIDFVFSDQAADFGSETRVIRIDPGWLTGEGVSPEFDRSQEYGGGSAYTRIVLTSGTTGDPKAVALSHDMMLRRLQAYDVAFGQTVPSCSRFFIDLGLSASFGYTWSMWILARGGAIFLRAAGPAETLQAFELYNVECMIAAPAGVMEFLDYYERSPDFKCPFRVMMASGSLLSRTLSERVRARMCTNLLATYAATELSPAVMAPAHRIVETPGAVGYIAPWVDMQAVDDNHEPLPAGQQGIIRMRGHTMVDGYYGEAAGSDTFFRDGWFYPGDIGSVSEDRLLVIAGRQQAVLNVGGNKINPETIEAVMSSFPGIMHSAAFARPNEFGVDQIWAVVTATDTIDAGALRAHCARELAAPFVPTNVIQIGNMPLNEMGRLDRKSLPGVIG